MRITDAIVLGVIAVAIVAVIIIAPKTDIPSNDVKKFSSQSDLNDFVKSNSESYSYYGGMMETSQRTASDTGAPAPAQEGAQSQEKSAGDYSKTNVQVEGVDEADIVKNDGKYLYVVSGQSIVIVDGYPAENAKIVAEIDLKRTPSEIFINGNKLVVFGYDYPQYDQPVIMEKPMAGMERIASPLMYPYYSSKTFIEVYDISDKASPVLKRNLSLDGDYFDSRMIGDYAYAVINQPFSLRDGIVPLPKVYYPEGEEAIAPTDVYYFDIPDSSYRFVTVLALNTQNDEQDVNKQVYMMGYSENLYVSQDNVYITYMKRLPPSYYTEKLVEKTIIPLMPANIANEMRAALQKDVPSYQRMQEVQEIFAKHFNTLSESEKNDMMKKLETNVQEYYNELSKEMQKTVVHKIAISNGNIEYKANGEVPGQLLNQFSMDENNGYLRMATTTNNFGFGGGFVGVMPAVRSGVAESDVATGSSGSGVATPAEAVSSPMPVPGGKPAKEMIVEEQTTEPEQIVIEQELPPPQREIEPSTFNHVYVLDSSMQVVGKLEDLAPGERIYSARFIGDRAYLVTFVQMDPLFVIDLSDPAQPEVLGELKIPGVSQYLHPYDENHIIGIGKDAIGIDEGGREFALFQGMKISLFDVSDVSNPKEVAKFSIGDRGTDSEVLYDHKAFLFSKERNLMVLPVTLMEIDESVKQDERWAYGEFKHSGAYVFDVTLENGIVLKGVVKHYERNENEPYYYGPSIRRSLYIGNALYTISDKIKINDLSDLHEVGEIKLPQKEYIGIPETLGIRGQTVPGSPPVEESVIE